MAEKVNKKDVKKNPPKYEDESNNTYSSKKPSMKTASDVISRLLWDESLPKDKFVVGYLDRFEGITEKSFTSLDWNHPAVVDNYSLALPKHRIQYFKYRNRKVWDKTKRLDAVFGSTGNVINIYDFMKQVDREKQDFQEEDFNMNTKENSDISDDNLSNAEDTAYDNSERPNFFIAIRINNEEVVKKFQKVVQYINSRDTLLGECCIPSAMYHLTLSVLKLNSRDELNSAILAIQSLVDKKFPPVKLTLEGLDDFRQRVLFSKIEPNDELLSLRKHLVEDLTNRKLTIADKFSFVPHVTIAKLSRPVTQVRHSKYIDQYLYLKFEDDNFGTQEVKDVCLCEIGAGCREDGFYNCATEVSLY